VPDKTFMRKYPINEKSPGIKNKDKKRAESEKQRAESLS